MPGQTIQTWRQVVFATIVLAFIGATVGTAFGMVQTKGNGSQQATQHSSQPAVSPSPSASPSGDAGAADLTRQDQNTTTDTGGNQTADNRCEVPKLIGLQEADARKKFPDCLKLGDVKYTCKEQTEAGKVVWQSLDGGARVDRGSKLSVQVQGVSVPNVVGQYHGDARSALEHYGFKVSVNNLQPGAAGGAVSAQNPAANSCLKLGSTVTITVGTKPTEDPSPSSSPAAQG